MASELVITSPIENTLLDAGIILEQVHHGDGIASWAVTAGRCPAATASALGLRTPRYCPTDAKPEAMATWSPPQWPCRPKVPAERSRR